MILAEVMMLVELVRLVALADRRFRPTASLADRARAQSRMPVQAEAHGFPRRR